MRKFDILHTDTTMLAAIRDKIDNLNKPLHSLGQLEKTAEQLCLIQQTLSPTLSHPCLGNHIFSLCLYFCFIDRFNCVIF